MTPPLCSINEPLDSISTTLMMMMGGCAPIIAHSERLVSYLRKTETKIHVGCHCKNKTLLCDAVESLYTLQTSIMQWRWWLVEKKGVNREAQDAGSGHASAEANIGDRGAFCSDPLIFHLPRLRNWSRSVDRGLNERLPSSAALSLPFLSCHFFLCFFPIIFSFC